MSDELAVRVRDYARERLETRRPGLTVSSAWLAMALEVDPRTIAAALRPHGVRPAEIERGVRGYQIADLAGLGTRTEPGSPDAAASGGGVPAVLRPAGASSEVGCPECDGEGLVEVGPDEGCHDPKCCSQFKICPACGGSEVGPGPAPDECPPASALTLLSAGAGHDMTPALRAAGLL